MDASVLKGAVAKQTDAIWVEAGYRQATFKAHSATQSIPLIYDRDFRHFDVTRLPRYADFEEGLKPIVEMVSRCFGFQGWIVRCLLARLPSGGVILTHSDSGCSLTNSHRIHIPLVTNPHVDFSVGGQVINMKVGEIWEINNCRAHSVRNGGLDSRVHLILDWAEPVTHEQLRMYGEDRRRHFDRARAGAAEPYD